jgi:hypothetical protein
VQVRKGCAGTRGRLDVDSMSIRHSKHVQNMKKLQVEKMRFSQ